MRSSALALALLLATATPAAAALSLEDAVARVLATHPEARVATLQRQGAELGVLDASSARFSGTAEASVVQRHAQGGIGATTGTTSDQNAVNGTLGLTVPLFMGGKITHGVRAAEARLAAARAQEQTMVAELTYQVTQAFWALRRAELAEEVQRSAAEAAQTTLALTRTAKSLGRMGPADIDRAEVNQLNAQGEYLRAGSETRQARTALASMLGLEASELAIAEPTATPSFAALDALVAPARQPELAAAEAQLLAAREEYEAAGGDRWPSLALATTYQHGNNPYDATLGARNLATSWSGTWEARMVLSYNLFDNLYPGGKVNRALARAEASVLEAQATMEKTRRQVALALGRARVRVADARSRLTLAEQSTRTAERSLTWVQTRYQQGYASQFEVTEARTSRLTAGLARVNALIDMRLAVAELARALAGR